MPPDWVLLAMELAKEVQQFSSNCERLLSKVAGERPLTDEEKSVIAYYCHEVLKLVHTPSP